MNIVCGTGACGFILAMAYTTALFDVYQPLQHDAAVFRDLNDRLVAAVKGDRVFETALSFPRAADEDRADRIVDFEHLQVGAALKLSRGRLYHFGLVSSTEGVIF